MLSKFIARFMLAQSS